MIIKFQMPAPSPTPPPLEERMLNALTREPREVLVEVSIWDMVALNILFKRFDQIPKTQKMVGLRRMTSQPWLRAWIDKNDPELVPKKIEAFRIARRLNEV
jgi:hypothetical protein